MDLQNKCILWEIPEYPDKMLLPAGWYNNTPLPLPTTNDFTQSPPMIMWKHIDQYLKT